MTDRDEQLEAQLRARPLPGLSNEARRRLLADLASAPLDHANPPTEGIMDQILPIATRRQRQTVWRTIMTHRYTAACVAVVACVAAITGAAIVAHRIAGHADSDQALHRSNPPVVAQGLSANGGGAIKPGPSDAHRIAGDADSDQALHRSNPPVVAQGLPASGGGVAIMPGPTDGNLKPRQASTRSLSLEEMVDKSNVVVVATFLDAAASAKPKQPGDLPESSMRFRVARILKGKLENKTVTVQRPSWPGVNELAGKEWILVLSPEYIAGKHLYAALFSIEEEPKIRANLGAKRGNP